MADIEVVSAGERQVAEADATTGMIREMAMSDGEVWAGVVSTPPNRPSGWHHHGEHDTYFYVQSGRVRMEFGEHGEKAIEAEPGDFVHVPKHVIHREVNEADEPGAVILVRVGSGPPVVNVNGPDSA